MLRLSAAVGLCLALLIADGTVRADDGWNPFKERDQARRAERATAAREQELQQAPTLPPMNGVAWRPWLEDGTRADSPTYRYGDRPAPNYSDEPPAPWQDAASDERRPPASGAPSESVQRVELQALPPIAGAVPADTSGVDGPALAPTVWQGVDGASIGQLLAPLALPPRSGALADLWRRLLSSSGPPASASGAGATTSFDAVRIEALYRSGLMAELRKVIDARPPEAAHPIENLLIARTRIGLGQREIGCSAIKGLQPAQASLPKPARHDFLLLASLCGTGEGDASKAGLAAELLRAEGVSDVLALASLDALASGNTASFEVPNTKSVSLLDYRFLELVKADPVLSGAEPTLLATIATSGRSVPDRILAAEAALSLHAIPPDDLAAAYRSAKFSESALAQPFAERQVPALQRALLFQAFEAGRTPNNKARFIRALLDEIRRSNGPYRQAAAMLARALPDLHPSPDLAWFSETAIEISLAGHRTAALRDWASVASRARPGRFDDWLALADIVSTDWQGRRGEYLQAVERRAVSGDLTSELMHRLVTVLDALDYQIPIPLWEAASRSPQPTTGFLPETGVLSQLQKAAQQREQAKVVLLAMRALGPDSGETAHMITLGDTIRALKRVGLENEARKLGLEAVYMAWPRTRID
ncbi:MAG: hypothetical protein AB7L90_04920 [Hyphomicrobiaceae bacterium]